MWIALRSWRRVRCACALALMATIGNYGCDDGGDGAGQRSTQLSAQFVGVADPVLGTMVIQVLPEHATDEEVAAVRQSLEDITVSTGGAHTPNTVELVTESVGEVSLGCGTVNSFSGQVRMNSFFADTRLENTVAEVQTLSAVGREGCNSALGGAEVSDQYGLFAYGTLSAAGTPGASAVAEWKFKIPDTTSFSFAGQIKADKVADAPTCHDGSQNGAETAIDCGGGECAPCRDGQACGLDGDCLSGWCSALTCVDRPGIAVAPTSGLVTTEAGGTAAFRLRLDTAPTSEVTIGLSSSDTTEGVVSPTSVTFTPDNWNAWRTAVITGVDDADDDGNAAYDVVTAAADSADPAYDGREATDISVTNTDDDGAGPVSLWNSALWNSATWQ